MPTTPTPQLIHARRWQRLPTPLLLGGPVLLLTGVITLFVLTDGAGLNVQPAAPVEALTFERTVLRPGRIDLRLRNTGPAALRVAQVNINDAIWPFTVSTNPIPRLGAATLTLTYPWVAGDAYTITLFSGNALPFTTAIPVAAATPGAARGTLWSFTLVGIYVGIVPVVLGMFWLPALRRLGPRPMLFLMAATVGLLLYLGVDATGEAIQQAGTLDGPFQGLGLVGIGLAGTVLLLDAIGRRPAGSGRHQPAGGQSLATLIAIGIGLHNLGEGLAIGAAYAVGAATLGAFLVIGFIIQNITEGLGIVVPLIRDRPSLGRLGLLGLIAGAPAIAGAWIGGLVNWLPLSVLFLAIGAGAVFQVAWVIGTSLVWRREAKRPMPLTAFAGVMAGMLALYLTGLLVK